MARRPSSAAAPSGHDQVKLDGRLVHRGADSTFSHRCAIARRERTCCRRAQAGGEAARAQAGRGAVSDRLSRRVGRRHIAISPMPRIDGGIELLTSDGELAAKLQRAVRGLPMEFSLRVRGELSQEQIDGILGGELDSGETLRIESCEAGGGEGSNRWYRVVATGANGRDLRALVERQGALVSRVLRVALGGLKLERTLARGQVRQLTDGEIDSLLQPPQVEGADSAG
ncbi:MAG: hypothetical protein U1F39_04700 [Steroidobacteraceae bacterium]